MVDLQVEPCTHEPRPAKVEEELDVIGVLKAIIDENLDDIILFVALAPS